MIFHTPFKDTSLTPYAIIGVIVFAITAYNSHGYYQADEHYQIIEFARMKLGLLSSEDLAWEYKAQIRPSLQPLIGVGLLKTFTLLQVHNPYYQAFLLRLTSGLLAIIIISYFIKQTKGKFKAKSTQAVYILLSYFLWFIPFISVRFSSETWAGLFFLLSLGIVFNNHPTHKNSLLLGISFGISFLFRFQMAFAILAVILWLIIIKKSSFNYLFKLIVAYATTILLGTLLDYWFYGELTFTPWNYFHENIIKGAASGFGTQPWHFYFSKLITFPGILIGLSLILSLIILMVKEPQNLLLWCIIPFIIIHSLVSHKEERFLFPITFLFPLLLTHGFLYVKNIILPHKILTISFFLFIVINTIGLIAMSQKSAGVGRMQITKFIHDHYNNNKINLIFTSWANPYDPWGGLPSHFYSESDITFHKADRLCNVNNHLFTPGATNLLVIRKIEKENKDCCSILDSNFTLLEQSIPQWIEGINYVYKGFKNHDILELYKYNKLP